MVVTCVGTTAIGFQDVRAIDEAFLTILALVIHGDAWETYLEGKDQDYVKSGCRSLEVRAAGDTLHTAPPRSAWDVLQGIAVLKVCLVTTFNNDFEHDAGRLSSSRCLLWCRRSRLTGRLSYAYHGYHLPDSIAVDPPSCARQKVCRGSWKKSKVSHHRLPGRSIFSAVSIVQ